MVLMQHHGQETESGAAAHNGTGRAGQAALSPRLPQCGRRMAPKAEQGAGIAAQGDHAARLAGAARGKEMIVCRLPPPDHGSAGLFPSPALSECRHGSLARRLAKAEISALARV